jgi:hypothetical protein
MKAGGRCKEKKSTLASGGRFTFWRRTISAPVTKMENPQSRFTRVDRVSLSNVNLLNTFVFIVDPHIESVPNGAYVRGGVMKAWRGVEDVVRECYTTDRKGLVRWSQNWRWMKILNCSLNHRTLAIHVGSPLCHEIRHKFQRQHNEEKRSHHGDYDPEGFEKLSAARESNKNQCDDNERNRMQQ